MALTQNHSGVSGIPRINTGFLEFGLWENPRWSTSGNNESNCVTSEQRSLAAGQEKQKTRPV